MVIRQSLMVITEEYPITAQFSQFHQKSFIQWLGQHCKCSMRFLLGNLSRQVEQIKGITWWHGVGWWSIACAPSFPFQLCECPSELLWTFKPHVLLCTAPAFIRCHLPRPCWDCSKPDLQGGRNDQFISLVVFCF